MKGCPTKGSLLYFATMLLRIKALIIGLLLSLPAIAQQDTVQQRMSSGLRISLLTCGPGYEEVWEVFGHTAIRIVDSNTGTDYVYNYGTFSFGPDFELQFMRGKLLYYVSYYPYRIFVDEYKEVGRSIEEQLLEIGDNDKEEIYAYLRWNSKNENKYYKYDFFFDNCATRVRDVFYEALGESFEWGNALPEGQQLSYRDIMNQYFYSRPWERFGVNMLLGKSTDDIMSNDGIMYLPDFLRDAMSGARVHGDLIAPHKKVVLGSSLTPPSSFNGPLVITITLFVLLLIGFSVKRAKPLGDVVSFLVLFVSGLLGCIMLVMWFATDHQACQNNFNILWALPSNLIMAFASKKGKSKYGYLAIMLLIISLLLHVFNVQKMILLELSPLLLSLLFIYGNMVRKGRSVNAASA